MITEIGNLSSPGSITTGPDHNVWFASSISPVVGRITPDRQCYHFFPRLEYLIKSGPAGDNDLLFTEPSVNRIATITTSGIVTEAPAIPRSAPTGITPELVAGSGSWALATTESIRTLLQKIGWPAKPRAPPQPRQPLAACM